MGYFRGKNWQMGLGQKGGYFQGTNQQRGASRKGWWTFFGAGRKGQKGRGTWAWIKRSWKRDFQGRGQKGRGIFDESWPSAKTQLIRDFAGSGQKGRGWWSDFNNLNKRASSKIGYGKRKHKRQQRGGVNWGKALNNSWFTGRGRQRGGNGLDNYWKHHSFFGFHGAGQRGKGQKPRLRGQQDNNTRTVIAY